MEVSLTPEIQTRLEKLALETGRPANELAGDAITGFVDELVRTRAMLNSRFDELKSGSAVPVDGEAFFESLRKREQDLINQRASR